MAEAGREQAAQVVGAEPLDTAAGRGGSKRDAVRIEARRTTVADLYLTGWSQAAIGRHLAADKATISRDLKTIRAEWRRQRMQAFDEKIEVSLAKIDKLEWTYWDAWEQSKRDRTTKSTESKRDTVGNRQFRANERIEQANGDPAYLEGVRWCIAQRMKILGVEAAPKAPVDETGKAVTGVLMVPTPVTAEEWSAVAQAQQAALIKEHSG